MPFTRLQSLSTRPKRSPHPQHVCFLMKNLMSGCGSESARFNQHPAQDDAFWRIQVKDSDGRCANRGSGQKLAQTYLEVFCPNVFSGVEKPHQLFSIFIQKRSDVASFVLIAVRAGQAEVFKNRLSSMFKATDMVNMESGGQKCLGDTAIFAAETGTKDNPLPQEIGDVLIHAGWRTRRLARAFASPMR